MQDTDLIVLVTVTFLVAGFVKGAVGLGLPVVALAFMAASLGVKQAIAIMLLPGIVTNIWQALAGPALYDILRRLWSFLLAAGIGVWLGVWVLAASSKNTTLAVLGVLLSIYSAVSLFRPQIGPPGRHEVYLSPMLGGLGGVMFGMVGSFMVPGVLFLQALGLGRNMLVQALGITFITINVAMIFSFTRRGFFPREVALLSAYAIAPAVMGIYLGQRYRNRISEEQFRRLFFVALFFAGLYLIAVAVL